ncbi:hypothetical protein THIX_70065 [Thiomonas sp. X19]|nr:hypothetical protein THIX_70065 [Thiomonas sp. X19]
MFFLYLFDLSKLSLRSDVFYSGVFEGVSAYFKGLSATVGATKTAL